jgi:hypothetical protein
MARTSHLPNLGPVVAWVTLRLVTKESHWFWKRVPQVKFSFWSRDFPYRFRTPGCSVSQSAAPPAGLSLWVIWESELLLVCSRLHSEIGDSHGRCC